MKLQQAYFSESNAAGGWQLIGYTAPSGAGANQTTNFTYGKGAIAEGTANASPSGTEGWSASNRVVLNDCAINKNWVVNLTKTTTGQGDITFTSVVADAGCKALTPSFETIGK